MEMHIFASTIFGPLPLNAYYICCLLFVSRAPFSSPHPRERAIVNNLMLGRNWVGGNWVSHPVTGHPVTAKHQTIYDVVMYATSAAFSKIFQPSWL